MKQELSQKDDLRARREAMRERLRLQAERILEAVEQIEAPKTFVEVERAARAILAADKMIMQVFRAPKMGAFDRPVNAPSVTSSPSGFAVLRSTNDSLDRSLAHPSASQGRIKDASPIAGAKGENEKAANVNIEDKTPQPVFARLTKRQKRRHRAFKT